MQEFRQNIIKLRVLNEYSSIEREKDNQGFPVQKTQQSSAEWGKGKTATQC